MQKQNHINSDLPAITRINWRVDDFCRAHGIGRTYFYDEVKRGEIKPIKIGKRTLVPDSEARIRRIFLGTLLPTPSTTYRNANWIWRRAIGTKSASTCAAT